jgi:predicted DsbA family dithiol-disulfide isomerase
VSRLRRADRIPDGRPKPVRLIVYSDYLCPWCYNAAVRLHRVEAESAGEVEVAWRSYLLRPAPDPHRTLEKFRAYTRSWLRPAEEPDAGTFRVWQGDAGPPSHSIPPHLVAKAAASLGRDAFDRIHRALLEAYFGASRDITDAATLREIWHEAGLPPAELARATEPRFLEQTIAEHEEALRLGVNGVPAARVEGSDAFVTGAFPVETYRRWIERVRERGGGAAST